jgi:predicted HD superfamily hydrolase involved in NAD metabolism
MISYEDIKGKVKGYLSSNRYKHTLGVVNAAILLGEKYQVDLNKVKIAALLHDCAKKMDKDKLLKVVKEEEIIIDEIQKNQPALLHGPVGSVIAYRDFNIKDPDILRAIEYHTTGRENMSKLEKIIYLADYIEEGRRYSGVIELREKAKVNLDKALLQAFDNTINYIINKKQFIHPNTIIARNATLKSLKESEYEKKEEVGNVKKGIRNGNTNGKLD